MGRGSCSKAIRRANRSAERGKIPGGANHSSVPGKKWTRKDVLRVRQKVQSDLLNGLIDNSHMKIQKNMKKAFVKQDISKQDIIKSIKVMKPLGSNTE